MTKPDKYDNLHNPSCIDSFLLFRVTAGYTFHYEYRRLLFIWPIRTSLIWVLYRRFVIDYLESSCITQLSNSEQSVVASWAPSCNDRFFGVVVRHFNFLPISNQCTINKIYLQPALNLNLDYKLTFYFLIKHLFCYCFQNQVININWFCYTPFTGYKG